MKSIETNGKTVEDAIKAGLKELNCDLPDVTIDVLDSGSPGLFGMFGRLAKVRLTLKDDESIEMPVFSLDVSEGKPKKQEPHKAKERSEPAKKERTEPAKKERDETAKEHPAPKPTQNAPKPAQSAPAAPKREPRAPLESPPKPAAKRVPREKRPHDPTPIVVSMEDLPPLDLDALSEVGKVAYEFLAKVTQLMGVDVEIRIAEQDDQLQVQIIGDALGVLIGRRGDTLDALQYLTSLQVNKGREKYVRVTLDTEHYRAKRVDALTKLAERMADRAKKSGRRVALEPMNPYERRILHSALQGHAHVTTHSEGDEPYRRVIITLK